MDNRDLDFVAGQADDVLAELGSVDDLQVAAAAAAAAMGEPSSTDSESSDSEESSSGESMEEDSDSESSEGPDEGASVAERWAVNLQVAGTSGETVKVQFEPQFRLSSQETLQPALGPQAPLAYSSSEYEDESSDEEDSDDEEILEIHDYEDLRRIVDDMGAPLGDDGDGGGAGISAAEALFGAVPLPILDVELTSEDVLTLAGKVLSVIEGTVVVRASPGSRALNEGSVLLLEDRTIIGAVEDIFGPVQAPLYALRYAPAIEGEGAGAGGAGALPEGLVPDAPVFSIDRLSQFVVEEELRVKGYDGNLGEEAEEGVAAPADPEQQFSDDEAEAAYKRKLKAKRKGDRGGDGDNTGGSKPSRQRGSGASAGGGGAGGRGRGGRRGSSSSGGGGGRGSNQYHPQQQGQQTWLPHGGSGGGGLDPRFAAPPGQQQQQHFVPYPQSGSGPYGNVPYGMGGQQYHPGPPQYLGQAYPMPLSPGNTGQHQQFYPGGPMQMQPQFRAHATAAQFGAISLQPHHVHPYAGQPPPPPGGGGGGGPKPRPPPGPPQ